MNNETRPPETSCCGDNRSGPSGRKLLTVTEVAILFNVHKNTVYQWMNLNLVDWVYSPGGTRRIYEDSLIHEDLPEEPGPDTTPPEAA